MRVMAVSTAALLVGCGGLLETGTQAQLQELHRNHECAKLLQTADETYSFIADRTDLLAEANFLKADCLVSMGWEEDGIALYRYVAERHPESPFAYQARARVVAFERLHEREAATPASPTERSAE